MLSQIVLLWTYFQLSSKFTLKSIGGKTQGSHCLVKLGYCLKVFYQAIVFSLCKNDISMKAGRHIKHGPFLHVNKHLIKTDV